MEVWSGWFFVGGKFYPPWAIQNVEPVAAGQGAALKVSFSDGTYTVLTGPKAQEVYQSLMEHAHHFDFKFRLAGGVRVVA